MNLNVKPSTSVNTSNHQTKAKLNLSESHLYDETRNEAAKLYRKEILIPVFLMAFTLIAGNFTGISLPQLIVIAIGCIWYIISCYRVFREDEK